MEVESEIDIDDSFKRPGSIPFKWEIQPGVPKHRDTISSPLPPPQKLSPPPAMRSGAVAISPSQSPFPSASSNSHHAFSSLGCFSSPSMRYRNERKAAGFFALLRRRSMSDHYMPPLASPFSLYMREEADAFDDSSSSLALSSDAGSV